MLRSIYNNDSRKIQIYFFYVNSNNTLYNVKKDVETAVNGKIKEERLLYILKENQYNLNKRHKLISASYFNISINNIKKINRKIR